MPTLVPPIRSITASIFATTCLVLCSCNTLSEKQAASPAQLPDTILQETFEQGTYEEFYIHLNKAVLTYTRPSHSPELLEALWIPLEYLHPIYCFPEGEFDNTLGLCLDNWFSQYHGMSVEELVTIGRIRMHEAGSRPLSSKAAVEMALDANWDSGCRRFIGTYSHLSHEEIILGLDQEAGEILESHNMRQSETTSQIFTPFDLGYPKNLDMIILYNTLLYHRILDSFVALEAEN